MNKTITTIIIVAVLVIGGVLLFSGGEEPTDENTATTTQDESMEMEDEMPSDATTSDATSSNETSNEAMDQSVDATVSYTASGFSPATVEISQGDTVRFVNEGAGEMWVASAVHPTHTEYAGTSRQEHCENGSEDTFDQCGTAGSFTFTFDQAGEWGYHNHVNSSHQGTVIVN